MVKIADSDKKFAYIYAPTHKELKSAEKIFKTQIVDIGAPILYNGYPAILVRKSN